MQLAWGSYLFAANSITITVDHQTRINTGGQPYAQLRVYNVTGYLAADGQAAITVAENALKTALAVPYQDLKLFNDDSSLSSELLLNSGSITGVVVEDLAFPKSDGPEYATTRYFTFRARAEYPYFGTTSYLLSFSETLAFWGGGPVYAHRLAINGVPQKQLIYPASVYSCQQTGEATGYLGYPPPQAPKFPGALKQAPRIARTSPTRRGNGYEGFKVTWSYDFESIGPLSALPAVWVS